MKTINKDNVKNKSSILYTEEHILEESLKLRKSAIKVIDSVTSTPKEDVVKDYDPVISSETILNNKTKKPALKECLLKENYLSEFNNPAAQKRVRDNLGIQDLEDIGKAEWGKIKGNIINLKDLMDLAISFSFEGKEEITTIKLAVTLLMDKEFYNPPAPVSVNYQVKAYRKGKEANPVYNGMTIDKVECIWYYNNHKSNIESTKLNSVEIKNINPNGQNLVNFTENIISNKTFELIVTSNKVDSKGARPKEFKQSREISFKNKVIYWFSELDSTNIPTEHLSVSDNGSFDVEMKTDKERYIYMLFPKTCSYISIYTKGGVDPGGDVTESKGAKDFLEYENPVTYYLYKSKKLLSGNWTIKYH